jgi:hypothetical protein
MACTFLKKILLYIVEKLNFGLKYLQLRTASQVGLLARGVNNVVGRWCAGGFHIEDLASHFIFFIYDKILNSMVFSLAIHENQFFVLFLNYRRSQK